jgi:hypothetical protein
VRKEGIRSVEALLNSLNQKLQKKLTDADERAQQLKHETDTKVQTLQQEAAKAQGEAKERINAQIVQLRQQYEKSLIKLNNVKAENSTESAFEKAKAS